MPVSFNQSAAERQAGCFDRADALDRLTARADQNRRELDAFYRVNRLKHLWERARRHTDRVNHPKLREQWHIRIDRESALFGAWHTLAVEQWRTVDTSCD